MGFAGAKLSSTKRLATKNITIAIIIANTFILNFYNDNKEVKYYYLAKQVAMIADNKDMEKFFNDKLEAIFNKDVKHE